MPNFMSSFVVWWDGAKQRISIETYESYKEHALIFVGYAVLFAGRKISYNAQKWALHYLDVRSMQFDIFFLFSAYDFRILPKILDIQILK